MTSAADLYGLQEVDLRRDARRALLADIESRLLETDELISAREEAEDAEAQAARLRKEQRGLESQLRDLEAKIKALDEKLYSGAIHNPKELSDLQREVESLKAHSSKLSDEALSSLEVMEVSNSMAREAAEDLKLIEADWIANQEKLRTDKAAAEQEMVRLETEREARTNGMDRSMLGLYENLRLAKQGRAVSLMDRGSCTGCRVSLPTNLVSRVRAGAGNLVQCPRCDRILVAG